MLDRHIETLRAGVHETAAREQGLVRSLGEALTLAEEDLLRHVREIAAGHFQRRAQVLAELQELALTMGTFPHTINDNGGAEPELIGAMPLDLEHHAGMASPASMAGDWRRATSLIEEDEGVVHLLHAGAR